MCGITGIVDLDHPVPSELVREMTRIITHRGPDDDGFYFAEGVGLGHRRLSIIDVDGGVQPIHNEDDSVRVVFNGEIYNYRELTSRLKKQGHTFYTNTDTETIVHLYEEYGDDCVTYLRGMFAFALWDGKRQRLLLARDRVGKKPLAYYHRPGKLVFGSELKSILMDRSVPRDIGHDRIDQYLKFGYIPAPDTIYKEIHKLMPGNVLVYENDRITIKKYWDFTYQEDKTLDENECLEKMENLLTDSVRMRMIADVPLGAFLSGGVDSSLVVALMSHLSDQSIKTFTIGFEEEDYSEMPFARQVARHLQTDHHEEVLKPDIYQVMQELLIQYDEPFADSSMIPTYLVSKMARQYVTVALSGDGGDEVFAGYNRYTNLNMAQKLDRVPGIKMAAQLANKIPLMPAPVRRKLRIITQPAKMRQLALSQVTSDQFRAEVYTADFRRQLSDSRKSEAEKLYLSQSERLDKWQYSDIHAFLPNDILVKIDRASMLSSLETRAPLLDHHLIEFMATVPEKLRTKNGSGKYLLKKLAEKYLPGDIIYRKKMGFMIPLPHWFRGPLRPVIEDTVLAHDARLHQYLDRARIQTLFKEHFNKKMDHSPAIYTLLYLELWLRKFASHG